MNRKPSQSSILIVGGGFYGMYLANYLQRRGNQVILCEQSTELMKAASYNNQARVHNGYHYPRSHTTAARSHVSFPRFSKEFEECIYDEFDQYYLVGRTLSKVTARQFEHFCARIGLPCEEAPQSITKHISSNMIGGIFKTVEFAFDAEKLQKLMRQQLDDAGVEIRTGTSVRKVGENSDGLCVEVVDLSSQVTTEIEADHVFNCTYSMLNKIVIDSGLPTIPLKHELAEICLVEVPDELRDVGFTVMCGPFFSLMPFPDRGLHSFSHVRYTPHYSWHDETDGDFHPANAEMQKKHRTSWRSMVADARRYIPILEGCRYEDSLWEVKTVLPRSEVDDSRPIFFRPNYGLRGFHCVLGAKIDNVYDVINAIEEQSLIEQGLQHG